MKLSWYSLFIKCIHSSIQNLFEFSKSKNFLRSFAYKMFCVVLRLWHVHKKVLYKFIDIVQQVNFGTGISTIWAYIDNLAASFSGRGDLSGLFFLTARILMIQIMQVTFLLLFYKKLCLYCTLKVLIPNRFLLGYILRNLHENSKALIGNIFSRSSERAYTIWLLCYEGCCDKDGLEPNRTGTKYRNCEQLRHLLIWKNNGFKKLYSCHITRNYFMITLKLKRTIIFDYLNRTWKKNRYSHFI